MLQPYATWSVTQNVSRYCHVYGCAGLCVTGKGLPVLVLVLP